MEYLVVAAIGTGILCLYACFVTILAYLLGVSISQWAAIAMGGAGLFLTMTGCAAVGVSSNYHPIEAYEKEQEG